MKTAPQPSFLSHFLQRACAYWAGAFVFALTLFLFVFVAQAVAAAF